MSGLEIKKQQKNFRATLLFVMALFVAVAFVGVPAETYAVTKPAPVQITVATTTSDSVHLEWTKSKGSTYYLVCVGPYTYKTKGMSFTVRSGSKDKYGRRAVILDYSEYDVSVQPVKKVKIKLWKNKKTKKWTKKKPKKKYRGKTKYKSKRYYGKITGKVVRTKENTPVEPGTTTPDTPSSGDVDPPVTGDFAFTSATPSKIDFSGSKNVNFKTPCDGTVSGSSSNSNVVSVKGNGSKSITISAGKTSGTVTITCTFTPASGKTYNGNKKLTFSVKNTIYPTNSDGSYTVKRTITKTSEGYDYQDYVGGIVWNHGAIPDGSTVKLNAEEFPYSIYDESTHSGVRFKSPFGIASSTNPKVAYCFDSAKSTTRYTDCYPLLPEGDYIIGKGTTTITTTSERTYKLIVSGYSQEYPYFDLVWNFKNNVSGMSTYDKVLTAVNYIRPYSYPDPCYSHEAMSLVLRGNGDCWAGNSLLYAICDEMGLNPLYRYAGADGGGNGSGHVHVIVRINGTDYVADATPGKEPVDKLLTWTEYCKKHPYATKNW